MADDKSPEDIATTGPPKDYREWVQSQIANRMLLRLSGIGVGSLALFLGGYFTLQDWLLEGQRPDIVANVISEIQDDIKSAVLEQIINQSELIEAAEDQITAKDSRILSDIVRSDEFSKQSTDVLLERLREDGTAVQIILQEALQQALTGQTVASRALGLRLYALLHAGERASAGVEPMRKMFVQIVESHTQANPLSPKLLEVVLEHYPLGEHPTEERFQCSRSIEDCVEWDRRVIQATLSRLDAESEQSVDTSSAIFREFFEKVPPDLVETVISWVRRRASGPKAPSAQSVLFAIAGSTNDDVLSRAVPGMAEFVVAQGRPELRPLGLEALARTKPDADLMPTVRKDAISRLWGAASARDRNDAFSAAVFREVTAETTDRFLAGAPRPLLAAEAPMQDVQACPRGDAKCPMRRRCCVSPSSACCGPVAATV